MSTTTIRISRDAHRKLVDLSERSGRPLVSTVEDAIEALITQRFAARVADQMAQLRGDPEAWDAYTSEGEPGIRDGLDR